MKTAVVLLPLSSAAAAQVTVRGTVPYGYADIQARVGPLAQPFSSHPDTPRGGAPGLEVAALLALIRVLRRARC